MIDRPVITVQRKHARTEVAGRTSTVSCELRVEGMDCASCAATIVRALENLEGVHDVSVDVVGGRVRANFPEGAVTRGQLAEAVRRAGFRVEHNETPAAVRPGGQPVSQPLSLKRRGRLVAALASGVALGMALIAGAVGAPRSPLIALLALSTIAGGWYVVPRGFRAAMNRALDMNFLMSVAAGGAWVIGEQTEAAATLFLFAIAELLEAYSMDRARNAIKGLMELSPSEATVIREGRELRVPAAEIEVGETVVVRPGEKIAVDGKVTSGWSSVNQAPITGEAMPVDKEPGDGVFAGSLNGQGALRVRSTKVHDDTTLARILHAVEEAQASRAPSQTFVDRFARIYTPAVVFVAILIAIVPPLAGLGDWGTWVYRSLAMLVVACPCALVISTPVSFVSGLTGAARAGILIKGGAYLERAASITTVCFDKTGTLTLGRPSLTDVLALDGRRDTDILRLASGVERHSEHPLAMAVLERGNERGITPPESRDFEALAGRGARHDRRYHGLCWQQAARPGARRHECGG